MTTETGREYAVALDTIYARRDSSCDKNGRPARVDMKAALKRLHGDRMRRKLPDFCWTCARFGKSGKNACAGFGKCAKTRGMDIEDFRR